MNVANAMTSVLGNQDHEDLLNHFSEKAQAKRGGNQKTVISEIRPKNWSGGYIKCYWRTLKRTTDT